MKLDIGTRVSIPMGDGHGNPLYGTILDNNVLGFMYLVRVDTPVNKEYCYTDSNEVLFIRNALEKLV